MNWAVWIAVVILVSMISSVDVAHATDPADFLVKLGVMEPATGPTDRLRETHTVTMDPARKPGYCFLVQPPNDEPYQIYSVHHLPAAPERLTGAFDKLSPSQIAQGVQTPTERTEGVRPFCFDFDPGDPLGGYRIEVFVNDALKATLELDVVAPEPSKR
jgi:hypothetical protein